MYRCVLEYFVKWKKKFEENSMINFFRNNRFGGRCKIQPGDSPKNRSFRTISPQNRGKLCNFQRLKDKIVSKKKSFEKKIRMISVPAETRITSLGLRLRIRRRHPRLRIFPEASPFLCLRKPTKSTTMQLISKIISKCEPKTILKKIKYFFRILD